MLTAIKAMLFVPAWGLILRVSCGTALYNRNLSTWHSICFAEKKGAKIGDPSNRLLNAEH